MASGDMTSLRGIALQADGRVMYVADREMGILVIDLEGEKVAKLAVPATLNLGGIDGLYLWDNHLAIIQNGIKPQRVMRLQLDPSGTQVTAVRPLAIAQPEFDRPSFGVLKGKDLYYFGSSQWLQSPDQRKPVTVLHTPLDSSADIVAPDMASFFDQQDEQAAKLADKKEKD
jgi:hypothetical protein